jgi:hypothetical protein
VHRGAFGHHDCVRFAQRPRARPRGGVHDAPILAFTIPILAFTMRRSWRSRWTDPRVHDRPKPALSATASIPTFRGEGYLRTYDALFIAYVTKDFGPLHADLNLGENVWRLEGDPRPQHWVALALSMNLPPPFGVMAEGYYFTNASPVATRDGGFLFAIDHSPEAKRSGSA